MPSSLPALVGAVALAAAGIPSAPGGALLWMPTCHGGVIPLNLPGKEDRGPTKSCPGACHAGCVAREGSDEDPEDA